MSETKTVSIITLGCAKNTSDTDNLAALLKKRGYGVETDPAKADAIVVHTCSFIEAAKRESIQTIVEAGQLKGTKKKLIVTGCMVQQHGQDMLKELPEVDAFLGTGQLHQVADFLDKPRPRFLDRTNPGGLTDPDAPRLQTHGPTANLRLSEGCSHPCSFCVIPKLRGGLQSRPEELILKEARELAATGVEELVIIGQDTGDWGHELYEGQRLPGLLRKLRDINGVRWIRLMYMHPHSFSSELLNVFAESPDVFPYLDMPLQHIDNHMLMEMKRKLGEKDLRRLVGDIRSKLPNLSLRTTFIVGFPGESDKQFQNLLSFVNEGLFNYLGSFTYSREENTPAAIRMDQVPDDVKQERQTALTEAHYNVAHQQGLKRIGSVETVVLEETEGDDILARSRYEAPDIDAIIRLPQKAARGGRFVKAKITGYDSYEFTGEPI